MAQLSCVVIISIILFSAMVYHMPYFLQKYKYVHDIGVAQVERKNYDQRVAYFDCTNRSGGTNKKKVSEQVKLHNAYLPVEHCVFFLIYMLF